MGCCGDSDDAAELARGGARDDHAAVEASQSPPPLRCEECGSNRHRWRVSTFVRHTPRRLVRLYRVACTCSSCTPSCGIYRTIVEPNAADEPFRLPNNHWASSVFAAADRVPEQRLDAEPFRGSRDHWASRAFPAAHRVPERRLGNEPTVELEIPEFVVGSRSGVRFPEASNETSFDGVTPLDTGVMRRVLDGLRRRLGEEPGDSSEEDKP